MTEDIDAIDRKILRELTADARLPVAELARRVGLSKTPVAARLRAMEESGLIAGYRVQLSPVRLGLTHVTYVQVSLSDTRERALGEFNAAVRRIPELEECYMIAGGFDYLLKVRSRDIGEYRRVLGETISALPHVASTSSFVAMEAVVDTALTAPPSA
ncbi:Lrp/AsnC family transcriptional regulator [Mangrovicoccus algicola]|uniref:Lrp/AsnC family transcriptional regulator n=1 Tax=Mangrovicoccus algicola TaxID=2771008 RepID=A0A8J6Z8Q0_9RHOB|nr:Lrp/AsnC family transcriptional regulator [Mangrovicoccus algicola]MBE3639984.1 Lrp/AsnC family transcriptional regulator [Mangrovicoccus algicola]